MTFLDEGAVFAAYLWGPEANLVRIPVDREHSGFIAKFDVGFAGNKFEPPDNLAQKWVDGSIEFGVTRDGAIIEGRLSS